MKKLSIIYFLAVMLLFFMVLPVYAQQEIFHFSPTEISLIGEEPSVPVTLSKNGAGGASQDVKYKLDYENNNNDIEINVSIKENGAWVDKGNITIDDSVALLKANARSSEIKFSFVSGNIPDGDILLVPVDSDNIPGNAQGHPFRLKINIGEAETIDLNLSTKNMELSIEKPPEDAGKHEKITWNVSVNSSNNYILTFDSAGFTHEDEEVADEHIGRFIRYEINSELFFKPGEDRSVSLNGGNNSGEFKVEYYSSESWYELKAGEYKDNVKVTVSAD